MNVPAGSRATLVPDIQGSFVATLESGAGTLSKAGYRPYGESASATGGFRYTGQRQDPETNGLYYYRARMYSPRLGRFLQADPAGYGAGGNLYAYVGNDPLNNTDPDGLAKVEILYRPIVQTAYLASHSYVVVSESNGSNPTLFRAGPGNNGTIYAQSVPYGPGSLDYTPAPRASTVVINDNLPASYYESLLQNFQAAVNAAAIPYNPLSTNSNAYAAQAVEALGVSRPQAPTFAPGYGTVLPLTPDPALGLAPSTGQGLSNPGFSSAGVSPSSTSSSFQSGSNPRGK